MFSTTIPKDTVTLYAKEVLLLLSGSGHADDVVTVGTIKKIYSILGTLSQEKKPLVFEIQNKENGELQKKPFNDYTDEMLLRLYKKAERGTSPNGILQAQEITTRFIRSDKVLLKFKFESLCMEYLELIKSKINSFHEMLVPVVSEIHDIKLPTTIALDLYGSRFDFIKENIDLDEKYIFLDGKLTVDTAFIIEMCSKYLLAIADAFILEGKLIQLYDYLKALLNDCESTRLQSLIIRRIFFLNDAYLIVSEQEINDLAETYGRTHKPHDPSTSSFSSFKTFWGVMSAQTKRNLSLNTTICFTIPCKTTEFMPHFVKLNDTVSFRCSKVQSLWSDPIFIALRKFNITGMSFAFFDDKDPDYTGEYTYVELLINDLYVPHLSLTESGHEPVDFTEKNALIGRTYYPHKEFVIGLFLENYSIINRYLDISKRAISINLFSTYISKVIKSDDNSFCFVSVFIQTRDEYADNVRGYFQRLSELNITDDIYAIRDLLINTNINSEPNLRKFMIKLLHIFFKDNVENNGIYTLLRNPETNIPYGETEQQKLVYSHLNKICHGIGIQMTREAMTGNGFLDYLCTYTDKGNIYNVCIELKLAHGSIDSGITKQLPKYMRSLNSRNGIFLVLWFKDGNYPNPSKYDSISDLEEHLIKIKDNDKIELMVVDCTKQVVPSKL